MKSTSHIKQWPEVWSIQQSASDDVCRWFRQIDATSNAFLGGGFIYLVYYEQTNDSSFSDSIVGVEISVEEFMEKYMGPKLIENYEVF